MKPGPAIEAFSTKSSSDNFGNISAASSRGFFPALLAITIAAFVEKSPNALLRGASRLATKPSLSFIAFDTYLYKFIFDTT